MGQPATEVDPRRAPGRSRLRALARRLIARRGRRPRLLPRALTVRARAEARWRRRYGGRALGRCASPFGPGQGCASNGATCAAGLACLSIPLQDGGTLGQCGAGSTCRSDGDRAAGLFCQTPVGAPSGSCAALLSTGADCASSPHCANGSCLQGVCLSCLSPSGS
ncbi:MAG: hypothetical protein ACYCWW_09895 [Deltaproteobacteria bacterium]